MEKRSTRSVPLLKEHAFLILAIVLGLTFVEVAFQRFHKENNELIWKNVKGLLRNEVEISDSYQIARSLSDIEKINWIECVKLVELEPMKRDYFSTLYKERCRHQQPTHLRTFSGMNGVQWELSFKAQSNPWLSLSHNLFRLLVISLVFGIWFIYYLRAKREIEITTSVKRQLDEVKQELVEATKRSAKADIAHQVAHDIRSPIGALSIGLSKAKDSISSELFDFLSAACSRIDSIANDLVDNYKKTASPTEIPDLCQAISEVVEEKRHIFSSSVSIDLKCQSRDFACAGDRPTLSRIISNLLNNGYEAISGEGEISIEVSKENSFVRIKIVDTGKGMPPETLEKLGSKGFSSGKDISQGSGSGLGVYHAVSTLREWGGDITFTSKPNLGTVAKIHLPLR